MMTPIVQAPMPLEVPEHAIAGAIERIRGMDLDDLLPLTLNLDGRPFDVKGARPMFAPLFRKDPVARRQIFLCGRQIGKAECVDSEILTKNGFTKMGDLSIGEMVMSEDGSWTRILDATPWIYGRDCYKVVFRDGHCGVVDAEHLWKVSRKDLDPHGLSPLLVTTLELMRLMEDDDGQEPWSIRSMGDGSRRHYIESIDKVETRPVRCIKVEHPSQMYLTGRGLIPTHNTASAAGYCTQSMIWRRNFRVLYVAPLALYTNRFHHVYMGKMIRECKLPWAIQDKECISNVNEKTFVTGGHFHGVSCFNSAAQAIGLAIDSIVFDEVQDLNIEFLPQILEVLGTSNYGHELYFGTARGMENTIQKIFDTSSQSEFAVKCSGCNHWNIPSLSEDALQMIQPHGVACSKCSKLLDVESGQWVHAYPDRIHGIDGGSGFVGWHVPQTIVKARITPHERYVDRIYQRLHGVRKYSMAKFLNEVMGISTETGSTPITPQQIRDASVLEISENKPFRQRDYGAFGGGVDWGGSEITSFTVGTIVGYHRSGVFHCVNAIRPTGIPDNERHHPLAKFFKDNVKSKALMGAIMADIGFVGSVQNRNLQSISEFPVGSVQYGSLRSLYRAMPDNYFVVDRTTLIYIVYSLIKDRKLLFPKTERFQVFTDDLKAMFIEEIETQRGTVMRFTRYSTLADDFLHALGYALFACSIQVGVDLPEMVGLAAGGSLTKSYIDIIGEEMPIAHETSPIIGDHRHR